jgi:hypothetical protein
MYIDKGISTPTENAPEVQNMGNNAKSSEFQAPAGRNMGKSCGTKPISRPAGAWKFTRLDAVTDIAPRWGFKARSLLGNITFFNRTGRINPPLHRPLSILTIFLIFKQKKS